MTKVEPGLTIQELAGERVVALPDRELMGGLEIKISGLLKLKLKIKLG